MKITAIALMSGLLLTGCLSKSSETKYVGYYVAGHEVSSFRACNDSKEFWLFGNDEALSQIYDESYALAIDRNAPYQPIYVEFLGETKPQATDGFEAEYDGTLYIETLLSYSRTAKASCK